MLRVCVYLRAWAGPTRGTPQGLWNVGEMWGDGVEVGGQAARLSEVGFILRNGAWIKGQITSAGTGGHIHPQKLVWFTQDL